MSAGDYMENRVVEILQKIFQCRKDRWEESVKVSIRISLCKKSDRNNFRGVWLLATSSRVLGRLLAKGLAWWAAHLKLIDENQRVSGKGGPPPTSFKWW